MKILKKIIKMSLLTIMFFIFSTMIFAANIFIPSVIPEGSNPFAQVFNITNIFSPINNIINYFTPSINLSINLSSINNFDTSINISLNSTTINNIVNNITIINVIQNYTNYINETLFINMTTYINTTIYNTTINNITTNLSHIYGELYNDTISTLTTATINVWYNMTMLISTLQNGFTNIGNGTLNCSTSGIYIITMGLSASSANNDDMQIRIIKNGAEITKSKTYQRFVNGNNNFGLITFITVLNESDKIQLQLLDATRNINTFTFNNIEVTMVQLS